MKLYNTLPLTPASTPDTSGATEQEVLINFHQLLLPEVFLVQDVSRVNLGCYTTRKILDAFTTIAALDGCVVAVRFGVRFFEKWEPGLVGIYTLGEVLMCLVSFIFRSSLEVEAYQSTAVGLIRLAIGLL